MKEGKLEKTSRSQEKNVLFEGRRNALLFPWGPIDNVDIIAGEKFASSQEIALLSKKKEEQI